MDISFDIGEIPHEIVDACREAGVPDSEIISGYEDIVALAILEEDAGRLDFAEEEIEACNGSQMDYECGQCDGWQEVLDDIEHILNES